MTLKEWKNNKKTHLDHGHPGTSTEIRSTISHFRLGICSFCFRYNILLSLSFSLSNQLTSFYMFFTIIFILFFPPREIFTCRTHVQPWLSCRHHHRIVQYRYINTTRGQEKFVLSCRFFFFCFSIHDNKIYTFDDNNKLFIERRF